MALNEREYVLRSLTGDHQAYGELISAYQGMVFAVALNVTGNHSDSEDVVQEAFLRAYQKLGALSDPSKFGPWLHTIARRVALQLLRERRRVPVTESEETLEDRADPDALTPAELYAKAELSQSLWAEVANLPPRTREAILLYYVEGFSIKGAAAFLGVSEGAMKMRLDFGREKLRETLTQKKEDELRRQSPSEKLRAIILAALPPSTAPTAVTSALGAGAAWVTSAKVVMAALLALTIGAGLLFAFRDQLRVSRIPAVVAAPSVETAPKPENSAVSSAPVPGKLAAAEGPLKRQASTSSPNGAAASKDGTAAPDGQALFVCEVMRPDATPVPGAVVALDLLLRPEEAAEIKAFHREVRTNEAGEVQFDRIPDGNYVVSAQDGQDLARSRVFVGTYLRQRLILQPGEAFGGVVLDQSGKPIPGARVVAMRAEPLAASATDTIPNRLTEDVIQGWYHRAVAETKNDGAFATLLPRGNRWRFLVVAKGFAAMDTGDTVLTQQAKFSLGHGGTLSGRVTVSGTNKPASGVRVLIGAERNDEERFETVAAADGAYSFANLRPGKYVLDVNDSTLASSQPEQSVEVRDGEESKLDVAVTPGATISGRVIERDSGKGIPGAKVKMAWRFPRVATTSATGDFRFSGVAAGRLALSVRELPGYRITEKLSRKGLTVDAGSDQTGVELTLINGVDAPPAVRGRVHDRDGNPVAGAFVCAQVFEIGRDMEYAVVRADANGKYSIGGLFVTGKLKVRAFLPGLSSQEKGPLTLAADGLDGVDHILERTGVIAGKVVGKSGKPVAIPDAYVYIDLLNVWPGAWARQTATVMKGGVFEIRDLPADKYELAVEVQPHGGDINIYSGIRLPDAVVEIAPGQMVKDVGIEFDDEAYIRFHTQQASPEEKRRQKEAEEERHRSDWGVKGQVVDANSGAPITEFHYESVGGGSLGPVKDSQGHFTVSPVQGPTLVLKIRAPRYVTQIVTVTADQVRDKFAQVVVKLKPGAIVEGTVVDPDGNPVAGAKVYPNELLDDFVAGQSANCATDHDGAFRLDTFEFGPQRICVEHPAYAISWTDVTVSPGKSAPVTIKLTHGGSIEGTATSTGAPLANVGISCRIDGGAGPGRRDSTNLKTDATGHFRVDNITPGAMTVAAYPPNPDPKSR
ncbi:MAG: sigma-70 family RNA polymerase sigma factor, partial [Candidatus Hydrogenedentes bacterium]|nr:sigma-70 family RNA polymerase sigma factor [Candidatus Hydrogenedentota bacterium]